MTKLIKNWEELSKVPPNDKYRIVVDLNMGCGHIIPVTDEPTGNGDDFKCFCDNDTFYGSRYKYSTEVLQKHGFDIELENWDRRLNDVFCNRK